MRYLTTPEAIEPVRRRVAGAEHGWFFAQIAGRIAERRQELGLHTLLRTAEALDCELVVRLEPREIA